MMDATILEIMESWPPELQLRSEIGERSLLLEEQTKVIQHGETLTFSDLRPGSKIRISLDENDRVESITILANE